MYWKKKNTNANTNRLKFSTYFAACTEQPQPILPPTTHRHVHPRWLTQLWHLEFGLVLFSFVYFLILSAWHFSMKQTFNPGVFSSSSSPTVVNKQCVKCCGIVTDPPLSLMSPPPGSPPLLSSSLLLDFAPYLTALPTLHSLCVATQLFLFSP